VEAERRWFAEYEAAMSPVAGSSEGSTR